ncbi:MAG: hypothetical protein ACLFWH_06355 [Actinomycetota bacterium]
MVIADGFEVLAKLIDNQEERGLLGKRTGNLDECRRRWPCPTRIIRRRIRECTF